MAGGFVPSPFGDRVGSVTFSPHPFGNGVISQCMKGKRIRCQQTGNFHFLSAHDKFVEKLRYIRRNPVRRARKGKASPETMCKGCHGTEQRGTGGTLGWMKIVH